LNTTPAAKARKVAGPNGPMMSVLVRSGVKSRKAALHRLEKSYPATTPQHRNEIVEKWWEKRKQAKSSASGSGSGRKRGPGRPRMVLSGLTFKKLEAAIELGTILEDSKIEPATAVRIAALVQESGGAKGLFKVLGAARQLEKILSR
jgi:acyl-CoA reductase-like NAD-dependent aldehyde dehydrogenase